MIKATIDFPGINPEPWTAPSAVRGKGGKIVAIKGGKNEAFQKALAESFQELRVQPIPAGQEVSVAFYFWRSSEEGNRADATNLLKAAEDALQGHLYANDRNNRQVSACIVAQGPDVEPRILIHIETFRTPELPAAESPPVKLPTVDASSPATEARAADAAWREANDPAEDF